MTSLPFLPPVKEIWGQLVKGSLLGHGMGVQTMDLEGQRKTTQKNCLLSEAGSLGLSLALCRLTPVLEPLGKGSNTQVQPFITLFYFFLSFHTSGKEKI